ncbi:hypothetical protein MUG91_G154n12 [Manis pentadactyla]|nr:hypothetical protein MUG91_G154n12 [Manis pentadactyla]
MLSNLFMSLLKDALLPEQHKANVTQRRLPPSLGPWHLTYVTGLRKMGQDLGICTVSCSPKPASTASCLQGTIPQIDACRHQLPRNHFLSA